MRHCFEEKYRLSPLFWSLSTVANINISPNLWASDLNLQYLYSSHIWMEAKHVFIELKNCRVRICLLWATDMSRWPQYLAQQTKKVFKIQKHEIVRNLSSHTHPSTDTSLLFRLLIVLYMASVWKRWRGILPLLPFLNNVCASASLTTLGSVHCLAQTNRLSFGCKKKKERKKQ